MDVFGKCVVKTHPYIYVCCVRFIFWFVYKHGPLLLVECLVCVPLAHLGFDHFTFTLFFFFVQYLFVTDVHSFKAGVFYV